MICMNLFRRVSRSKNRAYASIAHPGIGSDGALFVNRWDFYETLRITQDFGHSSPVSMAGLDSDYFGERIRIACGSFHDQSLVNPDSMRHFELERGV